MAYRDKDKLRAYQRKFHRRYRAKHPERHAGYETKRDKAARAAARRKARAEGREDHKAILRKSYRKHKAKRNAEMKAWRVNNWEQQLAYMRSFKARRRMNPPVGNYTFDDLVMIALDQASTCPGCGAVLDESFHVDHIQPIARGGSNWPANIQLLCPGCNQSKNAKLMYDWLT